MKPWLLTFALLTLPAAFPAHASAPVTDSAKTVITIEQQGKEHWPEPASPEIIIKENRVNRAKIDTDKRDVSCPCPYSMDKNGQLCGLKSEFNKTGGRSPDCYANGGANPDLPTTHIYVK